MSAHDIVAMKKLFNIREGWLPQHDTLPARFLDEGLPGGVGKGAVMPRERLDRMIRAYNQERGWGSDGYIPQAVIDQLPDLTPRHGAL